MTQMTALDAACHKNAIIPLIYGSLRFRTREARRCAESCSRVYVSMAWAAVHVATSDCCPGPVHPYPTRDAKCRKRRSWGEPAKSFRPRPLCNCWAVHPLNWLMVDAHIETMHHGGARSVTASQANEASKQSFRMCYKTTADVTP